MDQEWFILDCGWGYANVTFLTWSQFGPVSYSCGGGGGGGDYDDNSLTQCELFDIGLYSVDGNGWNYNLVVDPSKNIAFTVSSERVGF